MLQELLPILIFRQLPLWCIKIMEFVLTPLAAMVYFQKMADHLEQAVPKIVSHLVTCPTIIFIRHLLPVRPETTIMAFPIIRVQVQQPLIIQLTRMTLLAPTAFLLYGISLVTIPA